jgi:hypothetical protein
MGVPSLPSTALAGLAGGCGFTVASWANAVAANAAASIPAELTNRTLMKFPNLCKSII